jgi:cell division protein ZapA
VSTKTIPVHILGKDYQVACPEEERHSLMAAATELDQRMKTIRQSGTVIGVERIAVMAALNLAYELINAKSSSNISSSDNALVNDMCDRIDTILSR